MVVSTFARERPLIAEVAAGASAPPGSGMMVSPSRDTRLIWTPLCASLVCERRNARQNWRRVENPSTAGGV